MTDQELKRLASDIYYAQDVTIFDYYREVDSYVSDLIDVANSNGWLAELTDHERIEMRCHFEKLIAEELELW